jgi:tetratricopeptide (TPR) repeat protein
MPCPADETILRFLEGDLAEAAANQLKRHVDECEDCRRLLVHAARSFRGEPSALPGASGVGRYAVAEVIGAGGMGVVYRAHDPLLNRQVALKVLWRAEGEAGRARLLHEAEAMARLSHPNVVAVYDAGNFHDQIFLAMELVEGETLAAWLKRPRSLPAIVAAFVAAGRGLEAAHAAGLVHRDFKPQNVLRAKDGRVRVTDFGLARSADAELEPAPGASAGTPAYMAPEQFLGQTVDARSDQFCFCVALYEALYGVRPYADLSREALKQAVISGAMRRPEGDKAPPRWLAEVLARGLRIPPKERYANMTELLAALERGEGNAWRRRAMRGGLIAAMTVLALAMGARVFARLLRPVPPECRSLRPLAASFDRARRLTLRAGLIGTGAPFARDTADRLERGLAAYVARWDLLAAAACEDARAGRDIGPTPAIRLACLDDRRRALDATVELLATVDREVTAHALALLAGLDPVEDCADGRALKAQLTSNVEPAKRAEVFRLRRVLAGAQVRGRAGQPKQALASLEPVLERAKVLGDLSLEAEAMYVAGVLTGEDGDYRAAQPLLEQAAAAAEACGHGRVVAESWVALTYFVGVKGERVKEAMAWSRYAEAAIERLGGPPTLKADWALALGRLYRAQGRAKEALQQFADARDLYQASPGDHHEGLADALLGLSAVYDAEGDHLRAMEAGERALRLDEQALGTEHPSLIPVLGHMGVLQVVEGRYEDAAATYRRAIGIGEKTLGPDHAALAPVMSELGQLYGRLGELDEGLRQLEAARRIAERALGPRHADTAAILDAIGTLYLDRGDLPRALAYEQQALDVYESAVGPDHPRVGRCLHHLARTLLDKGEIARGLEVASRALSIIEKAYGPDGRDVAVTLTLIGEAQVRLDRPHLAVAVLERALDLRRRRHASPTSLAETQFQLALARLAASHDRVAARELALAAYDGYAGARGMRAEEARRRIGAWLDQHGGR